MAVYQDPNTGQWYNSDETPSGHPGVPVPPPAGQSGSNIYSGNGGSPPLAPYQPRTAWDVTSSGGMAGDRGYAPPLAPYQPRTTAVQGETRPATSITNTQVPGVTTPSGRSGEQGRQTRSLALPGGGVFQGMLSDEELGQLQSAFGQMAQQAARQMEFQNNLQQGYLDDKQAATEAQRAYNEALVETRNRELALQAARDAMEMSYKQQLLALQRQQLMYSRRRGGYSMRSARVRIV